MVLMRKSYLKLHQNLIYNVIRVSVTYISFIISINRPNYVYNILHIVLLGEFTSPLSVRDATEPQKNHTRNNNILQDTIVISD